MNSNLLSHHKFLVVILFISSFAQSFAQTDISIFGMGGLNYIPMKNFSHYLNDLSNPEIDEIGFNGIAGIKYNLNDNNVFVISSEIINKNASFSSSIFGATWNFKVIPIALGYQHLFSNNLNNFRPFAGLNLSYSFIEIEGEYSGDTGNSTDFTKRNRFGIEPNFGFCIKIVERFFIVTEIKYRYMSDIEFWGKDINLSGLILNAGFQVIVL